MSQKPLKKFKVDESFEPCPVMEGDELCPNGIFVFNITKMKEFIYSRPDILQGQYQVLIICPTSLKYQWKREIEKFTARDSMIVEIKNG